MKYDNAMYRYVHNLQGDIVAILDAAGGLVVEYKYDAWGKPIYEADSLSNTLGHLNPFRYRGYVWDEETELYYLRSRYCNSEMDRFISADAYLFSGRGNLFSYCENTPVISFDPMGNSSNYVVSAFADNSVYNKLQSFLGRAKLGLVENYAKSNERKEWIKNRLKKYGASDCQIVSIKTGTLEMTDDLRRKLLHNDTIASLAIDAITSWIPNGGVVYEMISGADTYTNSGKDTGIPRNGVYSAVHSIANVTISKTVVGGLDNKGNLYPTTITTTMKIHIIDFFDEGDNNDTTIWYIEPTDDARFF